MAKLNVTVKSTPPLTALAADVKTVVLKVGRTPAGARGKDGKPFVYDDFTPEQLLSLQGGKGEAGQNGLNGTDGDSAYQIALSEGFVGTKSAWRTSLKGDKGEPGPQGPPGQDGAGGSGGGAMTLDDGRVIKQRLITSKLSHTSYTRIPHGLSASDIIAVDVTVYQSQYGYVMLRETNNNGGYYFVLVNPNDITIALSRTSDESSRVKLQECRILITYLA